MLSKKENRYRDNRAIRLSACSSSSEENSLKYMLRRRHIVMPLYLCYENWIRLYEVFCVMTAEFIFVWHENKA